MGERAPLFTPPEHETLAARCQRLADELADYERDITGRTVLNVTAIKQALAEASEALDA